MPEQNNEEGYVAETSGESNEVTYEDVERAREMVDESSANEDEDMVIEGPSVSDDVEEEPDMERERPATEESDTVREVASDLTTESSMSSRDHRMYEFSEDDSDMRLKMMAEEIDARVDHLLQKRQRILKLLKRRDNE